MIQFTKPKNLNGTQLKLELNDKGIAIIDNVDALLDNGQGSILLDILESDKDKAASIVAAHNGTIIAPEPTIADKLASVGLSVTDLKAALGL